MTSDFPAALRRAESLGFTHVDVVARAERPLADLDALAETALLVSRGRLARELPADFALDAPSVGARRTAVAVLKREVADAARMGATHCSLPPGRDGSQAGKARFADACRLLGDVAAGCMLRLCIEAAPGTALPTLEAAAQWVADLRHPNVAVVLTAAGVFPLTPTTQALLGPLGPRLGYVQWDEPHERLPAPDLPDPRSLRGLLVVLAAAGYQGALGLPLGPHDEDPAPLRGRIAVVEQLLAELRSQRSP